MSFLTRAAALLALVPGISPIHAASQVVRGTVTEDRTSAPLPGVLVSLRSDTGLRAGAVLTDSLGRFTIPADRAGRYRVWAERIGLATTRSDWLEVGASAVTGVRVVMRERALELDGLTVDSRVRECRVDPVSAPVIQRWWDEARKALDVTSTLEARGEARFNVTRFEREWDADLRALRSERSQGRVSYARKPFVSLGPDDLATGGYVQGPAGSREFFAPDAEVLLSDVFLEQHCFSVAESAPEPGWIGLGFEPTRRRKVTDILGVLWVDTLTAKLTRLDFGYANLPDDLPGEAAGGRVDFTHLADGSWIVSEWWVRAPRVRVRGERFGSLATRSYEAVGWVDTGGVVESLGASPRASLRPGGTGALRGVVLDGVTGRPLGAARVVLSGTALSAPTDDAGGFLLAGVPPGEHRLTFFHAGLSDLGVPSPVIAVDVVAGDTASITLVSPGFEEIVRSLCREAEAGRETVLVGRLIGDEGPLDGIPVRAEWRPSDPLSAVVRDAWSEASTGSDGRYVFCGLPPDTPVEVRVRIGTAWRTVLEVSLRRGGASFRESRVRTSGPPAGPSTSSLRPHPARLQRELAGPFSAASRARPAGPPGPGPHTDGPVTPPGATPCVRLFVDGSRLGGAAGSPYSAVFSPCRPPPTRASRVRSSPIRSTRPTSRSFSSSAGSRA